MAKELDLGYDPMTFVGPLDVRLLREFFRARDMEYPHIKPDRSYIAHLSRHHGGIPRKQCFETAKGTRQRLGRFLNYTDQASLEPPLRKSWQGDWDFRLDWSVPYLFGSGALDTLMDVHFIPFASLYVGPHHPDEMCDFDMVCFDYRDETRRRPAIVVWYRDKAIETKWHKPSQDDAVAEDVAENFDEFLKLLHECEEK